MEKTETSGRFFLHCVRGALIGAAAGMALVAAFAFVLYKQILPLESVTYVNVGVKAASAAVGALIAALGTGERRVLAGALAGALYMVVSFVIFSLIAGRFEVGTALLCDLAVCAAAGAITGMLRNLRQ